MNNIDKILDEVSAEIVQGKIPANKVFNSKGQVVPLEQLKGSESLRLISAIKAELTRTGMIKNFNNDDTSNLDIVPFNKRFYKITPDTGGKTYLFNINSGKISEG